jgi:hypothetical protein
LIFLLPNFPQAVKTQSREKLGSVQKYPKAFKISGTKFSFKLLALGNVSSVKWSLPEPLIEFVKNIRYQNTGPYSR